MSKQIQRILMALVFAGWISTAQAVIIGVDIEAGQGSPTNWTSYTLGDANTLFSNLIAEDGSVSSVGFQLDGVISEQDNAPSSGAVIPSHSPDLTTVCCDILYSGPNPTVATWSGLEPLGTYNYWVFVSSTAEDTITATGSNVDVFDSPDIAGNSQAINGIIGDSALTFASYARQIIASENGTVSIGILSTGTPTPSGYAIELVSDVPLPLTPVEPVPTLSQWALIMLTMFLGLMVFVNRRRLF